MTVAMLVTILVGHDHDDEGTVAAVLDDGSTGDDNSMRETLRITGQDHAEVEDVGFEFCHDAGDRGGAKLIIGLRRTAQLQL